MRFLEEEDRFCKSERKGTDNVDKKMSDNLLECKATTSKQASKTKPSGHRGFYPLEKLSKHFENQTQPLYRWNLELTFPGVSTNFSFNSFYFFVILGY